MRNCWAILQILGGAELSRVDGVVQGKLMGERVLTLLSWLTGELLCRTRRPLIIYYSINS
jgi:hypothetical protein